MPAELESPKKELKVLGEGNEEPNEVCTFPNWSDLPIEMQTMIVNKMDFVSRTKLSFCSKHNAELVDSVPLKVVAIKYTDFEEEALAFRFTGTHHKRHVEVKIVFGNETLFFNFHPMNNDEDTKIVWKNHQGEEKTVQLEGCGRRKTAGIFVETILKKAKHRVKSMSVLMKEWPMEDNEYQELNQCTKFRIHCRSVKNVRWWLGRVPEQLHRLSVKWIGPDRIVWPKPISNISQIKLSKRVRIRGYVNFSEEQFFDLTTNRISFQSNSISNQMINKFIRQWSNGEVRKNFEFFKINSYEKFNENEILNDLTGVKPWDEEFERKAPALVAKYLKRSYSRVTCCQIYDNYGNSATLEIWKYRNGDSIQFRVTGKRVEKDGIVETIYSA